MKRIMRFIFLSLTVLFLNSCRKSDNTAIVWNTPIVIENAHNSFWDPELRLNRVELNNRETVIDLTVYGFSDDRRRFTFQPSLHLKAGDAVYALESIDDMKRHRGEASGIPFQTHAA